MMDVYSGRFDRSRAGGRRCIKARSAGGCARSARRVVLALALLGSTASGLQAQGDGRLRPAPPRINQGQSAAIVEQIGGPAEILRTGDVQSLLRVAAEAISDSTMAVAVVDRSGQIVGVYRRPAATGFAANQAVTLARTGAFFSNDQAPLSSRTVRSISGIHFPAGIPNTPNAALYGIESTNRGCRVEVPPGSPFALLPPPRSIEGTDFTPADDTDDIGLLPCEPSDTRGCAVGGPILDALGVPLPSVGITTGKANLFDRAPAGNVEEGVNPGGIPIFRGGQVVGGIGVAGVSGDRAEFAATLAAATAGNGIGFPPALPVPGAVFIEGIRLPFFSDCIDIPCIADRLANSRPTGSSPGSFDPNDVVAGTIRAGQQAPEGFLVSPRASTVGGLTQTDVETIVIQALVAADITRAMIRLPIGQSARMVIAVADQAGELLALFRMGDATMFSVDVALTKSRNAYYFSSRSGYEALRGILENSGRGYRWLPDPPGGQGWAITNRTLSYGGQPLFPPGIDLHKEPTPGPFFDLFTFDAGNPCTEGPGPSRGGNRSYLNQSGIVWFPGSAPLYKNGELIGGLGVSGDGVEQDDFVSALASAGFYAPAELRVDRSVVVTAEGRAVRLPYWKFPRNPTRR
jgi:uncharacterized protein GlcG (DUF336 family)